MVNAMPGMDQLPPQAADQQMTPENLAVFEQMRQEIPPSEFSADLLASAGEADPVAVAEFKAELQGLNLPPEVMDVLNQLVDEVLASPDQYMQIREKYLAQDIPEDLLPPAFDPEFFGALNIALDELRGMTSMARPPMGFAQGGIASLNPLADAIAKQGRYGDTTLAHVSPREIEMLKQMGGSGTINPMTGMPEFFIKKIFKGAKKALKKVGQAVKKFASSSVGKIVTTMALAFFLGPAAAAAMGVSSTAGVAAVSGFVGSAGSTALGGGNLKESLRAGALGGITAGAGAGLMGGAQAFQAGSYTGPTTVGGQFTKAKEFFTGAPAEAAQPLPDIGTAPAADTGAVSRGIGETPPVQGARYFGSEMQMPSPLNQGVEGLMQTGTPMAAPAVSSPTGTAMMRTGFDPSQVTRGAASAQAGQTPAVVGAGTPVANRGFFENIKGAFTPGDDIGFGQGLKDAYFPPSTAMSQADALAKISADMNIPVSQLQSLSKDTILGQQVAADLAKLTKGSTMLRQFAPLAATGLGIMALGGGFKEEEAAPPAGFEDFMAGPPMQKEEDRLRYGGVNTTAFGNLFNPYSYTPPAPRAAAKGGSMDKEFPRKTGPINGPGTGTSDDIPAMLSDGEFVFTAKAVRGMGNGSRRAGAKKMYALMRKLEGRKNG
jgi:hypothetical protein